MTIRIAMWSGPRNLSTALMRSFGARADTVVSDEPFYGAYLKATGDDQPMKEAVIAAMDCDWHNVARTLSGAAPGPAPSDATVWYQKHMAHHMEGPIGPADLTGQVHAFLIRDPARVVASYAAKRVSVNAGHLGLARQRAYFDREADRLGHAPPVVDAADILGDPAGVLAKLCAALGIGWDPAMLAWEPGRRATDGVWASHWYGAVEASTGFGQPDRSKVVVPAEALPVVAECLPHYEYLSGFRLSA
ncbi:sulfotransferase [Sphingosinicellaceae bacterium]|nr:sulfotransferase [Sphingosinicellaceae bacterium]